MEMLSERYGWTPDQIRSLTVSDMEQYLAIIDAKAKVAKFNNKKYGR